MHQMFFVRTTPAKFLNATITDYFGFVFEENLGGENFIYIACFISTQFGFEVFVEL